MKFIKNKNTLIFLIFFAAILAIAAFFLLSEDQSRVCFKNQCFIVELALTPAEQAKGLMFRKELRDNGGMLFVFQEEGVYPFWMKNTLIPLDIIWLNKEKEVVFISKNNLPCEADLCTIIFPGESAKYVLELNSGQVEKIGLQLGDVLSITVE